jgi:PEGA domain
VSGTGEKVAVAMKLLSGLCGLAAVVLFVLPLVRGEVNAGPRYITLQPSSASRETESPPPKERAETPVPRPDPEPSRNELTEEERSDFDGAILMVESEPSGATIHVDGRNQGDTPVSIGLECTPGKPLVIDFTLPGFEKTRHRTLCPSQALVKVTARLRKGSGKASGKK